MRAGLAIVAGAASAAVASDARAQQKVAQKLVQYVEQSKKSAQFCNNCVSWVAPNNCKIVVGEINPAGWCVSWGPAPKTAS